MTEAKHTSAPWTIPGQPDKICAEGYTRNGAAKTIATVATPAWMGDLEPWANARLIAAAPDLLAAAKEGRTDLMITADNARDAAKTDPRWEGVAEKLMQRVRMIDEAIAKAGGRE